MVGYANMKEGYIIVMQVGPNGMPTTIASEFNGGLHVKGMTSNGGTSQYGLQNTNLATGIFEDVWTVNPPPRPGFAPRLEGPTRSEGHTGGWAFDAGGEVKATYTNSFWQYSGCVKDVQDTNVQTLPGGSI